MQEGPPAGLHGPGELLCAEVGVLHGSAFRRARCRASDYPDREGGEVQAARVRRTTARRSLGPREERHRAREVMGNMTAPHTIVERKAEGFPFRSILRP